MGSSSRVVAATEGRRREVGGGGWGDYRVIAHSADLPGGGVGERPRLGRPAETTAVAVEAVVEADKHLCLDR